ncbi:sigma-54 interaction domain-containing protein [Aneurinibacillus sp. REN35]|uniref:sigma-54 interaction domain-containing protein n=1 Tax=Aneurinibacillus sp. REN35 TaxID=3237286 RepID=UPI003528D538
MFLSSSHLSTDAMEIKSKNPAFASTIQKIRRAAQYPSTILIEGESGTGKEKIAAMIHETSPRAAMPFVKVNCGAIPDALAESELFGYESGAFTGAKKEGSIGLFEQADKGTILLDEIGELPPLMQVKLLRALQEREIRRVGGSWSKTIDVRVIASTNRSLAQLVEDGKFREDLYYRLQVAHFVIPALRERPEDLPYFINLFLTHFSSLYKVPIKTYTQEAMRQFVQYHWPGNIRQLQNCIEGIYATVEEDVIRIEHLPIFLQYDPSTYTKQAGLRDRVAAFEKQLIEEAVKKTKSLRQAASILDVPHATLLRRIEKLGIDKHRGS